MISIVFTFKRLKRHDLHGERLKAIVHFERPPVEPSSDNIDDAVLAAE